MGTGKRFCPIRDSVGVFLALAVTAALGALLLAHLVVSPSEAEPWQAVIARSGSTTTATPCEAAAEATQSAISVATAAAQMAIPYPTPDAAFAQAIADALRPAYEARASGSELEEVARHAAEQYSDVKVSYTLVSEGDPRVLVLKAVPQPPQQRDYPYVPYFFWQDRDGSVRYQAWGEEPYRYFLESKPVAARVVRRGGDVEMGLMPAPWGSTGESSYWLLRLEDGRWQQVWTSGGAEEARQWVGHLGGRVDFVGEGIDTLVLRGPLPDDVEAARFFIEWRTAQQWYLSLWQRQDDAYERICGRVLASPMTALSEFMVALTAGDLERARKQVASPAVVQQALDLGLAQLVSGQWSAFAEGLGQPPRLLLRQQTEWGLESPSYRVSFAHRRSRWLVESIERIGD